MTRKPIKYFFWAALVLGFFNSFYLSCHILKNGQGHRLSNVRNFERRAVFVHNQASSDVVLACENGEGGERGSIIKVFIFAPENKLIEITSDNCAVCDAENLHLIITNVDNDSENKWCARNKVEVRFNDPRFKNTEGTMWDCGLWGECTIFSRENTGPVVAGFLFQSPWYKRTLAIYC